MSVSKILKNVYLDNMIGITIRESSRRNNTNKSLCTQWHLEMENNQNKTPFYVRFTNLKSLQYQKKPVKQDDKHMCVPYVFNHPERRVHKTIVFSTHHSIFFHFRKMILLQFFFFSFFIFYIKKDFLYLGKKVPN